MQVTVTQLTFRVFIINSCHALGCLLTLHALYHTIPHELYACEVKDVHSLQSFVSTHSEEDDSVLFTLCLQ